MTTTLAPPNYKIDGLTSEWGRSNFVNPPYGREQPQWIKKGFEEWQKGKTVVFLIPSRTDTKAWHDYCMKADEIRFIKGRLYLDDGEGRAPFPSAIVVFKAKVTVNDLATPDPSPITSLSNPQKHALYTLIASYKPENKEHIESDRNIAYREGYNDALQDYDNAIKGLFDE